MKNKKLIFISDFFYEDIRGGGESSDFVLFKLCSQNLFTCFRKRSHEVDANFLNQEKDNLWIISNFVNLSDKNKSFLSKNVNYIIYEHDYKCFRERHPTRYRKENYVVPKDQHINVGFYKNAKLVICQTDLQKEIIEKNLELDNCFSINGNLFSNEDIESILINRNSKIKDDPDMSDCHHNNLYCIINDNNPIKGKYDAIKYADKNRLQFSLLDDTNRELFLEQLSKFKGIILMPTILESCSRLAIEAKLMGLQVVSRNCPIMLVDFTLSSIVDCKRIVLEKITEIWNKI